MRHTCCAALIAVTLGVTLTAVSYVNFEQITVAATAIGFTATKITPSGQPMATQAFCRLRTAEISYRIDGGAPTTTVGILWEPGEEKTFNGHDVLANFSAIRTGATSGQLDCSYTAP
ncbi:MAG TPA: hypothetical protein VE714_07225 [Gemmatimonadales bacterium]|jgi:hypothetical protein|nr:hypothetical protein [Gemmatimonadales bacterium]